MIQLAIMSIHHNKEDILYALFDYETKHVCHPYILSYVVGNINILSSYLDYWSKRSAYSVEYVTRCMYKIPVIEESLNSVRIWKGLTVFASTKLGLDTNTLFYKVISLFSSFPRNDAQEGKMKELFAFFRREGVS